MKRAAKKVVKTKAKPKKAVVQVARRAPSKKSSAKKPKKVAARPKSNTKPKRSRVQVTAQATPLTKLLDKQRAIWRPSAKPAPIINTTLLQIAKAFPGTTIVPGGSFAKGTSLKDSHDVDVFVRFPKGTADTIMSETLRKAFPKAAVMHGSRDYLQLKRGGIMFEIVPVHEITKASEISNVTDMSPLHVNYVQSHLTPRQKDDVRLLKRFCKAAGVYGAESHVRGFSGYVLELLIAEYGSFERFLTVMKTWEGRIVLDPAKAYATREAALIRLNESKLGPLVLVDPLDAARNASAAVSIDSILLLQERAAAFLAKPSAEYFDTTVKPVKIRAAWKPAIVYFVTVKTPKGRQDIVGSKVLAAHEKALSTLADSEFPLLHSEWRFGEKTSLCWYVLAATALPKTQEQRGPPSAMKEAVSAFKHAHHDATERQGRWYAQVPRTHTQAISALKAGWQEHKITIDGPRAITRSLKKPSLARKGRKEQKR